MRPATEEFARQINTTSSIVVPHLQEERAEELLQLAEAMEKDFPHLHRSLPSINRSLSHYKDMVIFKVVS